MNQGFYPYYNNNSDHNAFGYTEPRRKHSTNRLRSTSAQQVLTDKKAYIAKVPAPLPSTKLLRPHSKSNVDKPRLRDISSQESDQQHSSMSTEFKKWSSQQKIHSLWKAKSQNISTDDYVQYMRQASYPYQGASQQRQYYGNINNRNTYQHTRDKSHQSQQSLHSLQSLQSESNNTQVSNNGVSSSSDDFIKYYTDYASPSPTQMNKMWTTQQCVPGYQLNNQLSNTSQASTSTKHSGSIKNINLMHRNSSTSSIFYEISKHFQQCIHYIQQQIPRDYIKFMNEAMVKITLEFCGFDIENSKKFNPFYTQLVQHLKLQNITITQNASKMNYFVYSGERLIGYLKQCLDLLSSYVQSPRSIGRSVIGESLVNVLYSYYVKKHSASSMSAHALTSFYQICYEYRSALDQMKKMNHKLAVVKNLFNDDTAPTPATVTTETDSNSTTRSLGNILIQHNMTPQISAPVKCHQIQPNPINHSKSHPELSNNDKAIDETSENGGESTPVLSDINDIDHHLSSSNNIKEYDSDIQSEMSATPQPTDIQNTIIQQFIPNTINQSMHEIKEANNLQSEVSNDADDEVSSPGSMSTSTDNETVATIKTLTPTPHTSQIIKYNTTPIPPKKSGFVKRQSWTDIAMEKIDVFVNNDKREFKMMQPLNQKQGVENMIKEYRKSLGQNELKDSLEELRKEYPQIASTSGSDEDNANIVDVNEQSDCSESNQEEEDDDEFFDDDELEAKQAKYISLTQPAPKLNSLNSNDTTSSRYQTKKNKNKHNRRNSDSETTKLQYYQYSNNTVQSKHRQQIPLDLKYYNSNSSRHSRSSSDFIGNNSNLYKKQYNYQLSLYEDDNSADLTQSPSPKSANSARIYQKKHDDRNPLSPRTQNSASRNRRIVPAKCDQIRKNYIVRSNYVDQHKSFSKYSSDRNKSWKKWIKLLQSHDSDITNVISPAQVQTLIDFARMSLGNYGNWLMMKSGTNNGSTSSLSSNKSNQNKWTTYFAVMRDFNLFLFRNEYIPSSLDDVLNEDYLALSVAHIESVKQCSKNSSELYLEVTGSKTNHKLKFRCESTESCQQWVAEMNYQIHIVSDLCCNQALRLECADQKRSIWIPVAPQTQINPYSN